MINFDDPIRTKSDRDIVQVWNELKESYLAYEKCKIVGNPDDARALAVKITKLQNDIGIKQKVFPELS